jgi:hypothetical protein
VFFNAILVAANAALLDLDDVAGASADDREQLTRRLGRGRAGLSISWPRGVEGLA